MCLFCTCNIIGPYSDIRIIHSLMSVLVLARQAQHWLSSNHYYGFAFGAS